MFYVDFFNLEVIIGYMLFLFKLEVNVFNLDMGDFPTSGIRNKQVSDIEFS